MKRTFFLFVIGFAAIATVAYLAYLIGDSLYTMYKDRRLAKELDELEQWAREKKAGQPPAEDKPRND